MQMKQITGVYMNCKMIDALLDADSRLVDGWGEARMLGRSDTFDHVKLFMDVNCKYNITILSVFRSVSANAKLSTNDKWHALEGLAAGLGEVACKLGFIGKYRISKERTILNLFAMEVL